MANALKCDRCKNYFDYDPEAKFNFVAFGHKDIVVGRNFPIKDICPDCMEQFMKWFENPDSYDPNDLVKNINDEDISEATKFVETKSSKEEYKDPCKSCFSGTPCEQCDYGYISEEDKKKRWLENHKDEVKLSDPYEEGGL